MGIIKAVTSAMGAAFGDQWLEVVEPDDMGDQTVFVRGVQVRKGRGSNLKGSGDTISNGSVIHVYPNQFMMLVDGGARGGLHRRGGVLHGEQLLHAFPFQRPVRGHAD